MFVLGAVEAVQHSVRSYYARWGYGFSGHLFPFDVQVLAILLVVSMAACVHFGTKYVTLFSNLFLCATMMSIVCTVLGCILFATGVDDGNLQQYDRSFGENLWPRYEPDPYTGITPDFFSSLALIYPCVTGMLSGMSKNLMLKNPSHSIPKGTFWAIISCTLVYLTVCWLFGMTISNRTLKVDKFVTASVSYPHELIVRPGVVISCFGLLLNSISTAPNLMADMAGDDVLPCLGCLRREYEGARPTRALWFTATLVALPTLGGHLDFVSPYATIFYLLMYAGVNASTTISGFVRPPGFRPTFRYFHWSVSFVGFVWCLGLSFCISSVGTFVSLLAFLLMHAYIKKARRLAKSGIKWGTLGNAVRYNIVSSALNSLAKSAASDSSYPTEVTLSMTEEGIPLGGMHSTASLSSNGSVLTGIVDNEDEWVHFQTNSDFHAKNWRPQLLTIMDVDHVGNPINLHLMSLAAQLQQTGRGINVVIAIIDRSQTAKAASVASAIDNICADANPQLEDSSVVSEITGVTDFAPAHSSASDRWRNEDDSFSLSRSGIDHRDTVKLIQRSKALLMFQMKREGMDGFAEVSTTDGKFFEAVWSAVIHTGLGPLSPNTILLCLPSFLAFKGGDLTDNTHEENEEDSVLKQDSMRAKHYLRTINGILNLGKAVILFKGKNYPKNGAVIPERGIIDIWWIVHDGGLLLLLPFLLSKHSVWAGSNQDNDKKKTKRRRRQMLGAKLRLFAVTTARNENTDKLHDAVVDHLERLRIQAEVVVVDCLAGTNIADCMRDRQSVHRGSSLDMSINSSVDDAAGILNSKIRQKMGMSTPGSSNPVASLQKDGISTHDMTLGEVFASEARGEPTIQMVEQSKSSAPNSYIPSQIEDGSFSADQGFEAASLLNEAMQRFSSDANLVVTNLPFIHKNQCAQDYFRFVDTVCEGVDNVMLVRGSGAEVITTYA